MSSRHALTWRQWTGEPDEGLVPFLQQAPGLIYWLVHELFGHGAVLKISYELSQEHPDHRAAGLVAVLRRPPHQRV